MVNNFEDKYATSFGNWASGTVYYDPFRKINRLPEMKAIVDKGIDRYNAEIKALSSTTGGAGTAGYSMVPIYVDQNVVDRSRVWTPWTTLIQRQTLYGTTFDYNVITAKGAAVTAAEDAALADVNDTLDRESKTVKYLYSVGRVTGQAEAAIPGYTLMGMMPEGQTLANQSYANASANNAKQFEIMTKTRSIKELEENLIWNGASSTTATEFDGIVTQQSTTNKTDKNTADIEWADIETTVAEALKDGGRPNIAGCDFGTITDIRSIMVDAFHYRPGDLTAGAGFGVPASVVLETAAGVIPVVPSVKLSSVSGSKSIYFLDSEYITMGVLQDLTYQEMAIVNDSKKFFLKMYETLAVRAPSFNSWIGEIK